MDDMTLSRANVQRAQHDIVVLCAQQANEAERIRREVGTAGSAVAASTLGYPQEWAVTPWRWSWGRSNPARYTTRADRGIRKRPFCSSPGFRARRPQRLAPPAELSPRGRDTAAVPAPWPQPHEQRASASRDPI